MTVYLVGAGPGDPRLVTLRGAQLLAKAEVLLYDRLVPVELLELVPEAALRIDVGKRPGESRPRRQTEINELLVEHGRSGRAVVRLKGGDPFVFGRGGEEAEALLAAGIAFEVVPGVSSAFAVPAAAGVPVTHRGVSRSVTVVTGHVGDDASGGDPGVDWESLARSGGTLVVMMGMRRRAEIARRLIAAGRPEKTPVVVVRNGTTESQQSVRCSLGELAEVELDAPSIIVVGEVAELELISPSTRPLSGMSVVVTRPRSQSRPLVSALEHAGARVVELPVIAIDDPQDGGVALRAAVDRLVDGRYGWLAFTSQNAVDRVLELVPDTTKLAKVRLAAVGSATAEALSARGLEPELASDRGGAGELAEALLSAVVRPDTNATSVLFPRSEQAREILVSKLRAAGWDIDEVVAYRTVAAGRDRGFTPEAVDAASRADIVTFTSPSAVRRYLESDAGSTMPAIVACIGPTTAAALEEAGMRADVVADGQSVAGLLRAITEHLSQLRS